MLAASCYAETVDSESAGHALQLLSQMTRERKDSRIRRTPDSAANVIGGAPGRPLALVVDLEPYIRCAPGRRLASGRSAARRPHYRKIVDRPGSHTSFGGRLLVHIVGAEP
jgi:hypothetical protein